MKNITFVLNDGIKKIFGMLLSICILATVVPCVVFGTTGSTVNVSFPKDTNVFVEEKDTNRYTKKNGLYILEEGKESVDRENGFLAFFRSDDAKLPYKLARDNNNTVIFTPNNGTDLSKLNFTLTVKKGCAFEWNGKKYIYDGSGNHHKIENWKMPAQETVSARAGYGTKVKLSKEVAENLQNDGVTEIKVKFGADKNTPEDTVKFDTETAKSEDVEEIAITSKKSEDYGEEFISTVGGRYYNISVERKGNDEKGFGICELNASINKKTVKLTSESEKGKVYLRTYKDGKSMDRELKNGDNLGIEAGEKADIVLKPNPGYAVNEEEINDPKHGLKYVEEDLGEGNEAWEIFGIWDGVDLNANDLFAEAKSEVKGVKLEALGIESLEVDSSELPGNIVVAVDLMNDSDKNEMTEELKSNGCITAENDVYSFFNMNVTVDGKKVSELKEPIKIKMKLSDDSLNKFSEKRAAKNTKGNPMLIGFHETKENKKILYKVNAKFGADKSMIFYVKKFSPYAIIFTNEAANSYLKTGENIEVIAIMMSLLVMAGGWLFIDNKRKLKY